MTDKTEYRPAPFRTTEEIEELAAFLAARVEPLRVGSEYGSEERKVFEGLLNLIAYTKGAAKACIKYGDDPILHVEGLTLMAHRWDDHPDWKPEWTVGAS